MAKMQIEGMEEYAKVIRKLSKKSEKIIEKSVYVGAGIIADGIKEGIKSLPVSNKHGTETDQVDGVTAKQKSDMIDGFGVASIKHEGDYVNTKVGWRGYGTIKTKKYPSGVPNVMLVRSVISGTSFRKKNAFVDETIKKMRKKAKDEMAKTIDEEIKKEMD